MATDVTIAEVCIAACSDTYRESGEVLAHAVGTIPTIGARLAKLTHSPDLVLSDGEAFLMSEPPPLGKTGVRRRSDRGLGAVPAHLRHRRHRAGARA